MSDKVIQGNQYQATIAGTAYNFTISNERLERFFNEIKPNDKFTAFNNLLISTVQADQQEALHNLIKDDFLLLMKLFELFSEQLTTSIAVDVKKL